MDDEAPQVLISQDLFEISENIQSSGITVEEAIADIERQRIHELMTDVQEGRVSQSTMFSELLHIKQRYQRLLKALMDN